MFSRRPYPGVIRKDYKERIMNTVIQIKSEEMPNNWSDESRDFINKLLIRKEEQRLGSKGAQNVKDHPWFKDIIWEDLLNQKFEAPFQPQNVIINFLF